MRIVIIGDGLLGTEIFEQTKWDLRSRKKANFSIYGDLSELDEYSVIVNCIAHTNTYESNRESHWDVNCVFLDRLIDYCNQKSKKLIHISTDYIYAGSVSNASEDDVPIHIGTWYGYTKNIGDALVQLRSKDYLVCRMSHKPNPFPYDFAWDNINTNCDYVDVIAKMVIELIKNKRTGVYNVGTDKKTIYQLALKTKDDVFPVNRNKNAPSDITMDLRKIKSNI
jgi:dTDP-4-dehydrorhamnose reductase